MFLKIMHDGADEFLFQAQSEATYSVYADVVSCHFRRPPGTPERGCGIPEAHIWCREPVKTADVPGYAEIEKFIILDGDAFLMNDQGRTISKFVARPFGTIGQPSLEPIPGNQEPSDEDRAIPLLQNLPYSVAAMIRTVARQTGSVSGDGLKKLLDKARVAEDA